MPQTPLGELTALPRPLSWNKGALLLREGEGKRKGRTGRELREERKGGEGRRGERREGCRKRRRKGGKECGREKRGGKEKRDGKRGTRHTNPDLLPAPMSVNSAPL